jgi:SPP1 family predicted phage head-tail adaptor
LRISLLQAAAPRRITFERAIVTQDAHGGEIEAWSAVADAFAEVLFGTGQERREAAQELATQAATFIVPWTPTLATVAAKDRINGIGVLWDITSAALVGLNKEIHFTAVRGD